MKNVIIVGAGPSGLFTAYELITKNKNLNITILDEGRKVKTRVCPMNKQGIPCQNCNPCNILSGYGGAGTFSDGKLNFIPKLGKSDLTKYMSPSAANELIDDTEEIFNKFNMNAEVYPKNSKEANEIRNKVTVNGAKLLLIKQKHLGSDHLPKHIEGICNYLSKNGVTLKEQTRVIDIEKIDKNIYEVICLEKGKEKRKRGKKRGNKALTRSSSFPDSKSAPLAF